MIRKTYLHITGLLRLIHINKDKSRIKDQGKICIGSSVDHNFPKVSAMLPRESPTKSHFLHG